MSQDSTNSQDRGRRRPDPVSATDADSLLGARRAEKTVTPEAHAIDEDRAATSREEESLQTNEVLSIEETQNPVDTETTDESSSNEARFADEVDYSTDEFVGSTEETAENPDSVVVAQEPNTVATETDTPATAENATPADLSDVRAKAVEDKPALLKLRATIMAVAVPLAIFALSARAIASTAFLWLEYHRPGFPEDSYGFSTEERMRYGSYGVNYILNWAPSSYLSDLRVTPKTKLFLGTEVQHMTDVKHVMLAGMLLAAFFVLAAIISSRTLTHRSPGTIRKSLFVGSLITLIAMITLGVLAALGWDTFFTNFHHVLFPQGNWEFRMSDSLIRLYPPQFWVDAGIAFAALAIALTALMLVLTWPGKNRRARAKLLRDFRDEQKKRLQG